MTITCYVDEDGDGYSPGGPGTEHCGSCPAKTTPRAPTSGQVDCDDNDPDANPGNAEAVFPCDGIDNDCDGRVDEDERPSSIATVIRMAMATELER